MMISSEQASAAAQQLRLGAERGVEHQPVDVSPEVLAAALAVAESTPDTRPQRVADAQDFLAHEGADSIDVASMMIKRIVSDSLR